MSESFGSETERAEDHRQAACKANRCIIQLEADNAQLEIYLKDERDKVRELEESSARYGALLADTEAKLLTHQWISAGDRLPVVGEWYLAYSPKSQIVIACYNFNELPFKTYYTHWKTITLPPDIEKDIPLQPKCKWLRSCGTCYNLSCINRGGPCPKECRCFEKGN